MTPEQRNAAKQVLNALVETVKEMGTDGMPLGPAYAAFNARGMSYETFMNIIGTMQSLNLIKISNNCAYWIGR